MTDTQNEITQAQISILQGLLNVPHRVLGPTVADLRAALQRDPNTVAHLCAWANINPKGSRNDDFKQAAIVALLTADATQFPDFREAGRTMLLGNAVYKNTFPENVPGLPPYQILRVDRFLRSPFRVLLGDMEVDRLTTWDFELAQRVPGFAALTQNTGETAGAFRKRVRLARMVYLKAESPATKNGKLTAAQSQMRIVRTQWEKLNRLVNKFNGARNKNAQHWSFEAKDASGRQLPAVVTMAMFRVVEVQGHAGVPRLRKSIMADWLKALENNPAWFDSVAVLNREDLKDAYQANYIPRSPRAQASLFGTPPEDSTLALIKRIAAEEDMNVRARMVMESKLPDTVAQSLLGSGNAAWVARIAGMTPNQALNSVAAVEESGVLSIPAVKAAFDALLARADQSAAKILGRRSSQSKDEDRKALLNQTAQKAVDKSKFRIRENLWVLFDKSGSTGPTIEFSGKFAAWLVPYIDRDNLLVCSFDYVTAEISCAHTIQGYLQAFSRIKSGGGTNLAQAVEWLVRRNSTAEEAIARGRKPMVSAFLPRRIVVITDGGENDLTHSRSPFAAALRKYLPGVPVTLFGMGTWLEARSASGWHPEFAHALSVAGIEVDLQLPKNHNDYTVFDQIVTVLGGPSPLQAIMDTPLPRRILEANY